jgi:hypothetical protein
MASLPFSFIESQDIGAIIDSEKLTLQYGLLSQLGAVLLKLQIGFLLQKKIFYIFQWLEKGRNIVE